MHDDMHPDDDVFLMQDVKQQLDSGIPVVTTFRLIRPDEPIRWIKITMHPYMGHAGVIERIDGIMMDITEKKRSELALEESEQRYKPEFRKYRALKT